MTWLADPNAWAALATLTALEIVLGVDNIIFISIVAGKLPPAQRERARVIGLALAMFSRIALLFALTWLLHLTSPLFTLLGNGISGRDIILIGGGLFLLGKSTLEIHENIEGHDGTGRRAGGATFMGVMVQIMLLDVVFSLDSVITAIGMAEQLSVMVLAIVIAVLFMMFASGWVSRFIEGHPTVKVLALSFLILVGMALVGEGLDLHIPKGYIYFAMAFSVFVEALNTRIRRRRTPPPQAAGADG